MIKKICTEEFTEYNPLIHIIGTQNNKIFDVVVETVKNKASKIG